MTTRSPRPRRERSWRASSAPKPRRGRWPTTPTCPRRSPPSPSARTPAPSSWVRGGSEASSRDSSAPPRASCCSGPACPCSSSAAERATTPARDSHRTACSHPGGRCARFLVPLMGGGDDGAMEPTRARRIAERAHWPDREPDGTALLAHIRRVVAATPPEAHTVAWLHESLETGRVSEHELLREGLGDDELRALRLLTRSVRSHSD